MIILILDSDVKISRFYRAYVAGLMNEKYTVQVSRGEDTKSVITKYGLFKLTFNNYPNYANPLYLIITTGEVFWLNTSWYKSLLTITPASDGHIFNYTSSDATFLLELIR